MKFTIVIEKSGPSSWSAYCPDVPGCAAAGDSPDELRETFADILKDYCRLKKESGGVIPQPTAIVCTVEVDDEVA